METKYCTVKLLTLPCPSYPAPISHQPLSKSSKKTLSLDLCACKLTHIYVPCSEIFCPCPSFYALQNSFLSYCKWAAVSVFKHGLCTVEKQSSISSINRRCDSFSTTLSNKISTCIEFLSANMFRICLFYETQESTHTQHVCSVSPATDLVLISHTKTAYERTPADIWFNMLMGCKRINDHVANTECVQMGFCVHVYVSSRVTLL